MLFLNNTHLANYPPTRRHYQERNRFGLSVSGFSLLEVLISLLIFTVGFLGLASLQHVALSTIFDATLQNTAVELADSLRTRVHVEGSAVDLAAWQQQISEQLPNASGQLTKQGDFYQIRVQWQESSQAQSAFQHYQIGFKKYD